MPIPEGYRFPDVSRYRTVGDWNVYGRAYPISACKATEGNSHKDPSFPGWRANMRARGLLPIPYHFLRNAPVMPQVDNYLETADDGAEFGVMLDLETAGDGSNPTVEQANAWMREVSRRTGIPTARMMLYTSRWWYSAFGNGADIIPCILWNAHYSLNPNVSPFAGHEVRIIQYSSTAPVAGLNSPGTGDMNSAINMTVDQFKALITGAQTGGLTVAEADDIMAALAVVRQKVEAVYVQNNEQNGDQHHEHAAINSNTDAEVAKVLAALDKLDEKVSLIDQPVAQVDAAAVVEALRPILGEIVQQAVDAELDTRTFKTD